MKGRQASEPRGRWGEVLLGGLAGLGVPVLLLGVAGRRGGQGRPAAVGVAAGLLGALVGGGLARRRRGAPERTEARARAPEEAEPAMKPEPLQEEDSVPRRGPSGRERYESSQGASNHAH